YRASGTAGRLHEFVPDVSHSPLAESAGGSFAALLRTVLRHADRDESFRDADRRRPRQRRTPASSRLAASPESWRSAAELPDVRTTNALSHLRRARECGHRQLRTLSAELAGPRRTASDCHGTGLDVFRVRTNRAKLARAI